MSQLLKIQTLFLRSCVIFCFSFSSSFAQKKSTIQSIIKAKDIEYESKTNSVDSILKATTIETIDSDVSFYLQWLYRQKKIGKIVSIATNQLKQQEDQKIIDSLNRQKIYYYLGVSLYKLKQYNQSITALQSAIELKNNNNLAGIIYATLGKCYNKKADYYQSIKYYQKSHSLLAFHQDFDELFRSYVNVALPYKKIATKEGFETSRAYLLKADSLIPKTSIGKHFEYVLKMGIADSYNQDQTLDITKASYYYQKAIDIHTIKKDSFNLGLAYSNLGNLYNTTDPTLGIQYQNKSLRFFSENDSLQKSVNYGNIAYCYAIQGAYDKSIRYCLKSIAYLGGTNKGLSKLILKNNLSYKDELLIQLEDLAAVYFKKYQVTNRSEQLKKAIETYKYADQLLDRILIESQELKSQLFWRTQSAELYGKAIEACYLANDYETAFYFMEKNKALLLIKDLKNQQLKQASLLPPDIIKKELGLKKLIYSLNQNRNSINKDTVDNALFHTERDLKTLQDSIQQNLEGYKAIDIEITTIHLQELQNSLNDNEAVIEYNISEYDDYAKVTLENNYNSTIAGSAYGKKTIHSAYGLLITKSNIEFFKLQNASTLKEELKELRSKFSKPFEIDADFENYKIQASEVFKDLFPSKKIKGIIKNKKLRIIPDGYLNILPFEALITSEKETTYFLEQNEISYAYSNTFLGQIERTDLKSNLSLIAFAPVEFEDLGLTKLSNSKSEVNQVKKHFDGVDYIFDKATKSKFVLELPNYDLIHLATHADAQDSIAPWIAFKSKKLVLDELYLHRNKAKLVVLSGCNTLLGKQETGEGVMSLARGFFHSGAQSVVSSLWSIDDRSTATIMNDFYTNLKKGESKPAALRNAKLDYIKNHSLSEASPYYWASFIFLGNGSPVVVSWNIYWYFILSTLIFMLLGFFLRKFF